MEAIKLWQLEGSRATLLASNHRLESEQLLEETLVENPGLLIDGLILVGRQTPTEGGPLDLLGVDEDGRLAVFELKRGTLFREAVAQIVDYASYLDDMELEDLATHIAEKSGAHGIDGIDDFEDWYGERFDNLESLKPLRLFLVGLGADSRTERMVRFLANNSGLDISLLTFHGFDQNGKTLLAKHVEVQAVEEGGSTRRRRKSRKEAKEAFDSKLAKSEVAGLFADVKAVFSANWPASREWPNMFGLALRLRRPTGSRRHVHYARLDPERTEVRVVFFPGTIRSCREEFAIRVDEIPFRTWPANREPLPSDGGPPEIHFRLTPETWPAQEASLTALVQAIYEVWQTAEETD